jgi:hypothetical protein
VQPGAFLAFLLLLAATPALAQAPTAPHVSLTPAQAVHAQMEALANNDDPYGDHGIEVAWRFASSENKVFTGPLGRFKQMVRGPVYGPMIGHGSAAYEIISADGGEAVIDVILRTPGRAFAGYRFRLSRQKGGPCDGCWMTDAVVPIEVTSI